MNYFHWNFDPEIFSNFYFPKMWVIITCVGLYLLFLYFNRHSDSTKKSVIRECVFWIVLVGALVGGWFLCPEVLFNKSDISPRWYGVSFATGLLLGYFIVDRMARYEGIDTAVLSKLFAYIVLGTVVGARLGHCLFYEPGYYLSNPMQILAIWKGGLASHGGTCGVAICIILFALWNKELSMSWILDRCSLASALTAAFIRLGNFFNSEIIGVQTEVPWAVVFEKVDQLPRHPTQLYEALSYLISFLILLGIYIFKKANIKKGLLLGWLFILVFGSRFFIEFVKIEQVDFEKGMFINMGQILSIPFVLTGVFFVCGGYSWLESKFRFIQKLEHTGKDIKASREVISTSSNKKKIKKQQRRK